MIKLNKAVIKEELQDFITTTSNILEMHHSGVSESLQQQWRLEIGLARMAEIFLKGIEDE